MRRILIIIGIVLLICCVGGGIAAFFITRSAVNLVNAFLQPVTDATEGFMTNLKNQDFAKAYDQLSPEAQTAVGGSADAFKTALQSQGLDQPQSWAFTDFNSNAAAGGVTQVSRTGTAVFKDGTTKYITINLTATVDANNAFIVKVLNINATTGTPT